MTKFNVGDKVKCVDAVDMLQHGKEYVVIMSRRHATRIEGMVNVEGVLGDYYADRFELVKPASSKVSIKGGMLTIQYEGVTLTFDTSNEKSRMLVDAVIDAIYGDE